MEYCLAAAALNAVDRRSLQRSARLGREVLERAKRRAVDWHSPERSRGCVGVLYGQDPYQERWSVPGPQSLLGEVREGTGEQSSYSWPPLGGRKREGLYPGSIEKMQRIPAKSRKVAWKLL